MVGSDLSDYSMIDLFRSEVETHVAILNDGLLALETNPNAIDNIESLMRAAHSIKGGARIVELDEAVKLSHIMEDCFVAIQKREVILKPEHIDILLKGVDMLSRIAENAGKNAQDWLNGHEDEIDSLLGAITSITNGEPIPEIITTPKIPSVPSTLERPVEIKKSEPEVPEDEIQESKELEPVDPPASEEIIDIDKDHSPEVITDEKSLHPHVTSEMDRMVRVTAGKVERLMGLAGEVVLSTRWLPSFSQSLLTLKKGHVETNKILERLQGILDKRSEDGIVRDMVTQARTKLKEYNQHLVERMNRLEVFTSSSEALSDRLYHEIIGVRMSPFADGVRGFPRMVRDIARKLGKKVQFKIIGENTEVDRDILEKLDAPLIHLLRNAIDHGIEFPEDRKQSEKSEYGTLTLEATHRSGILMITISDDGTGVNLDSLKGKILSRGLATQDMVDRMTEGELMDFLFLPGFTTVDQVTEVSGRGVGLDVVHNMVHSVGGVVRAVSKPGKGVTFTLELPLTLSVVPTFLVEISQEPYAFPLARIDRCLVLSKDRIETAEDREYFRMDNKNIALVDIHEVLQLVRASNREGDMFVVIVSDRMHSYGLLVDRFLGECELVVRPLDHRLGKMPGISSASIMLDGAPVLIFDIEDMVRLIDSLLSSKHRFHKIGHEEAASENDQHKKTVLVVDDSITVREMERKLLENKGYNVEVAVDGMDGWNMIRTGEFDMVVSDIDMPRMNGFELISHIKQHDRLKSLPVMIVSYKNKEEDRLRGLEIGANYYLTKTSFQDNSFIDAVVDLIGEA